MLTDDLLLGTAGAAKISAPLKALSTHAFCVGMTGSGKTGLCVVLMEELLDAGVPVIAVDSKGDLASALLNFGLRPEPYAPFTADPAGFSAHLEQVLAAEGVTAEQFTAWSSSFERRVFTPGSVVAPLNLLGTLAVPEGAEATELADAADATARSLLGLVGVDANPVHPEYLLVTQLLTDAWAKQQPLELGDLVRLAIDPPFSTVGALPLETFFPRKDRMALGLAFNAMLASPRFSAWRSGEPFDFQRLLRAEDGRPRLTVYSIAHLADEERIFALALLLDKARTWMRQQGGSDKVRAAILIDELFGYFPPNGEPATKKPLLYLLKQARAFGLSMVLATQNPVDLDYRGLSNIGTWLVGRLQTEQDKARIRDAMLAAAQAQGVSPAALDEQLSSLKPRQFLLHSVHRPAPVVFASRDAHSMLRGPLSTAELTTLARIQGAAAATAVAPVSTPSAAAPPSAAPVGGPVGLEPELGPLYEMDEGQSEAILYVKFAVRFRLGSQVTDETTHEVGFPLANTFGPGEMLEGKPYLLEGTTFQTTPGPGIKLVALPAWATTTRAAKLLAAVKDRLPSKMNARLWFDPVTKLLSLPDESAEAFSARVLSIASGSKKVVDLTRKLERKRADLAQAQQELSGRQTEKWVSIGASALGFLAGRSRSLGGVGSALSKQRQQNSTEGKIQDLQIAIEQLEQELAASGKPDPTRFVEQQVVPRANDVMVMRVCLAFLVP